MERAEWLKKMRAQAEALYDHIAPAYWVKWVNAGEVHCQFIDKFLRRLGEQCAILDAGCGAGRYDGMLLEAGHTVLGIDQSTGMLTRAREIFPQEHFPGLQYVKMGLQELDFQEEFDGVICVDAMEHISLEDWPGIVGHFQKALRPGGILYITLDVDRRELNTAYEHAKVQGLPVMFGEIVDKLDEAFAQVMELNWKAITGENSDPAVYHFLPSLEQVRDWLCQAGFTIEEEGTGDEYEHFLARKNA